MSDHLPICQAISETLCPALHGQSSTGMTLLLLLHSRNKEHPFSAMHGIVSDMKASCELRCASHYKCGNAIFNEKVRCASPQTPFSGEFNV